MSLVKVGGRLFLGLVLFLDGAVGAQDTVEISNGSAEIVFSLVGAYPIAWDIVDPEFVKPGGRVPLIYKEGGADFPNPFRLILDGPGGELTRFANVARYTLDESSTTTLIFSSSTHASGLKIIKKFSILNQFQANLTVSFYDSIPGHELTVQQPELTLGAGIGRTPELVGGLGDSMYSYVDVVGITANDIVTFELTEQPSGIDIDAQNFIHSVAIHDRYYLMSLSRIPHSVWHGSPRIPVSALRANGIDELSTHYFPEATAAMSFKWNKTGTASESTPVSFAIYAGPKDISLLKKANNNLENVMYSNLPNWMRWITFQLAKLLNGINGVVQSWWVTLLVLVVVIRILLFPVAQKAIMMNTQMMKDQAKLKPEIAAIKERYKDPTTQYQKTMGLYKEHGINPMAPMLGCVPVLLQLPILIAIFNLLGQEVRMQGATFLWVKDLSVPDQLFELPFVLPYFGGYFNLLPILMSVTMVLTTNVGSPAEGDQKRSQMRSMIILAFIFFALFYSFPAGLVLYWMMSNIGQYIQQEIMTRRTFRSV